MSSAGGSIQVGDLSATESRILDAAQVLFLAHGFSAVSTDRLSREAGVSKTSIYKYFGDMGGVFAALVRRHSEIFELDFTTPPESAAEYWDAFVSFGTRLLTLISADFCLQFDRILHEEARAQPELIKRFYELSYGNTLTQIADVLRHGQANGFVTKPQCPTALAENLICMWEGLGFVRARLGLTDQPLTDPAGWARHCVEALFPESCPVLAGQTTSTT